MLLTLWSAGAWGARIDLSKVDEAGKWGPMLRESAERALPRAEARLGLTLDAPVEIISMPDELEFRREVGEPLTEIVAVARPLRRQIVINRPAWLHESPARREQTLVHEMTHLIIGRQVKGRLPAWLDEGLAMVTAEEGDGNVQWRVLSAGVLDSLIPIERLMDRVTIGSENQDLAYAESYALTCFYIQQEFPRQKTVDPGPLARRLSDPELGERWVRTLWDPILISALETRWRQTYHTVWSIIVFLSGSSFMWGMITLLFLVVVARQWRMKRLMRERFGEEEEGWVDEAEYEGEGEEEDWESGGEGEGDWESGGGKKGRRR